MRLTAEQKDQLNPDEFRGLCAWHMSVADCLLGQMLGFEYVVNGDFRP